MHQINTLLTFDQTSQTSRKFITYISDNHLTCIRLIKGIHQPNLSKEANTLGNIIPIHYTLHQANNLHQANRLNLISALQ